MKIRNTFYFIIAFICLLSACTKDEPQREKINWTKELNGSVWAGEFKYTTGAFQLPQPFSVVINDGGTLTWSDLGSIRPAGTWKVDSVNNKIIITLPNKTSVTANLTKDSLSSFTNTPANIGFEVKSLYRSATPTTAILDKTTWKGKQFNTSGGKTTDLDFEFSGGKISIPNGIASNYQIEGAGVRFKGNLGYPMYCVFFRNFTEAKAYIYVNDISIGSYDLLWTAKKQ
jgi:hypothetical protein